MSQMSDYLENELLDHVFAGAAYTSPSLYLQLYTATPNDAGGGTAVSGNGYARTDISSAFGTAASRTIANDVAITTVAASGGSWGTVTHWGIFDASTSGNLLVYGAFDTGKAVGDGEVANIAIGELTIAFTAGECADYLANELLDHVFAGATYTSPSLYMALYSDATNDTTGGTELTGNAYARTDVSASFGTASSGSISNDVTITFPTATGNWTAATHFAIQDAASSGNRLIHGALDSSVTVTSGNAFTVNSGQLSVTAA